MLEFDHVFCVVADPGPVVRRLEAEGWRFDAGQVHRGQGTRNRRLVFRQHFLELVWLTDVEEARANPLRFDMRADWTRTGVSPLGFGFRGELPSSLLNRFWLYDALGVRLWISKDHQEARDRPLVFVLESSPEQVRQRREHLTEVSAASQLPARITEVLLGGPSTPSLPPFVGPSIGHEPGPYRLDLLTEPAGLIQILRTT